nr:TAL effector repeat-containing protein [Xanthomonas axonopodis]
MQRLLPVLCQAHGLTPDQVVAIASNMAASRRWRRRCSGCCRCCARPMA